jgi:hypothetical protein
VTEVNTSDGVFLMWQMHVVDVISNYFDATVNVFAVSARFFKVNHTSEASS